MGPTVHSEVLAPPPTPPGAGARSVAAPAPRRSHGRHGHGLERALRLQVPLGLYLAFTLVPFYWMLVFAFRPAGSTSMVPWPITFDNFRTIWYDIGFATFFRNSSVVGLWSMALTIVLAVAGGYALARYRFRGRTAFMIVLLCTQFIPGAMMLIPLFVIFRELHLINSLASLVLADTVFHLPLSLILSGFVSGVSTELEEAAMVDGCSRLRAFFAIVLPQLWPGIIAVGSFAFIGSWNNLLFALMFMSRQDGFTVPVGLSYTIGEYSADFGALAAGGVVAIVPVVCVFAVIQRYLVQGISAGAVKG
jgi:multiple sugar transport system permease protein